MSSEADCRCVDKDGKEIESCRCFRTFEPGEFTFDLASFASPRARIGITLTIAPDENDARGARIQSVMQDGPADKAGMQEGDIITHIDGHSLFDPLEDNAAEEELDLDASLPSQRLLHISRNLEPGDEVEVRYLRDGEARTATLHAEDLEGWGENRMLFLDELRAREIPGELQRRFEGMTEPGVYLRRFGGEAPQAWSVRPGERDIEISRGVWSTAGDYFNTCPDSEESGTYVFLGSDCLGGLRMERMNPKLGEYFGTEGGVLVADVHADSKLGLAPGDVILRVGDRAATAPDQLRRILRSYEPDEEVTLHIMRQKRAMTVSGTLGR